MFVRSILFAIALAFALLSISSLRRSHSARLISTLIHVI